jgi:hypothetical protein
MKKIFSILFLIAAVSTNIFAADKDLPNLGIVSQLVEIKYTSESYLSSILDDKTKSDADKLTARKNYYALKVKIDRIIYQLAADMRTKNSIKTYKRLNKYYKTHKLSDSKSVKNCYKPYALALENAYKTYKENINPDVSGLEKAAMEVEAVISILDLGWTVIKDINEMRGQKVDGVIEILDNLRLNPPSELDKKDEEKEKDKTK